MKWLFITFIIAVLLSSFASASIFLEEDFINSYVGSFKDVSDNGTACAVTDVNNTMVLTTCGAAKDVFASNQTSINFSNGVWFNFTAEVQDANGGCGLAFLISQVPLDDTHNDIGGFSNHEYARLTWSINGGYWYDGVQLETWYDSTMHCDTNQVEDIALFVNETHFQIWVNGTSKKAAAHQLTFTDGYFGFWGEDDTTGIVKFVIDDVKIGNQTIEVAPSAAPSVSLLYPTQNAKYGVNSTVYPYSGWINFSANQEITDWAVNDSRWTLNISNSTHAFFYNKNYESLGEGTYNINLTANNTNGLGSYLLIFILDDISPITESNIDNLTITNDTFNAQINYTDNNQLFSFNVSINGKLYYNLTGLSGTEYSYNLSVPYSNSTIGQNNITTTVCDAHTAEKLKETWDNDVLYYWLNKEIKFNNGLIVGPIEEDKSGWSSIETTKLKDKVTLTYRSTTYMNNAKKTFIVKGEREVFIYGDKKGYFGWLVVDGKYWVDHNLLNQPEAKYKVKRIDEKTVEVEISGLYGYELLFNSVGELNCNSYDLGYYYFYSTSESYNNNTIETASYPYTLNFNGIPSSATLSGNLIYNDSVFAGTQSGDTLTTTAPAPRGSTKNVSFYWSYTINGGSLVNTTLINNTAYSFNVTNCSMGLTTTYATNFSLYDEKNSSLAEADITGIFSYNIGTGYTKTYSLNIDDVNNFKLCIYPEFANITSIIDIYYSNDNYPQRRYYQAARVLDSITEKVSLYMLYAGQGLYARFRIIDNFENTIPQVISSMFFGVNLIEVQLSDDSGLSTFWVDPDKTYSFVFNKTGYDVEVFDLRPTSTDIYSVTLGGTSISEAESPNLGITYDFNPKGVILQNSTAYDFLFNLTSSYWHITDCTFYLKNATQILSQSNSSFSSNGCNIGINYNTGSQDTIIAEAVYELNYTTSITVSTQYSVDHSYQGDFSLKTVLDDLTNFSGGGFDSFGRSLLAMLFIFGICVWAIKDGGFTEPSEVVILIWCLVGIFSYVNWLRVDYASIPIPWLKQYIIFVLVSLLGGAYIIKEQS